jgi:ATP-dependent RNA helicase DHX29
MAKRKKTQLKPVARGFATTSLPKKVVAVDGAGEDLSDVIPEQSSVQKLEGSDDALSANPKTEDAQDAGDAEERSLQVLVDKLQEKTEKEVRLFVIE